MKRKTCTDCKEEKLINKFGHKSGKQSHLLNSICRVCIYKRVLAWREKNPDKAREQQRRHKLRLKEKLHELRRANKGV